MIEDHQACDEDLALPASKRIKPPPAISNVALQHAEWRSGQVQQITWSSQGDVSSVKISLYRSSNSDINVPIRQLLTACGQKYRFENSGRSMITLPAGLLPGEYHLEVSSSENCDVTAESAAFEVTCSGPPPAISNVALQQPIWHSGSQQQVTWSSQGDVPSVNISLYRLRSSNSVIDITSLAFHVENSGRSVVTVPTGLTPGKYELELKSSKNRAVTAKSAAFEVTCSGPPPAISNVALQQPIWHSGSQQQVTWSSQGDVPSVNISLYRLRSSNSVIDITSLAFHVENSGRSVVTVPTGLTPGKYELELKSSKNRAVTAKSAKFTVDDEHRERCVRIGLLLLGLPPQYRLPYGIIRKIAVEAATT